MQLNKIRMHGFKSFADKTDVEFGPGITVIVGPNGCGKSNVVDALKWVLGEQSAKSLRGGQMLDVIFNGSANRKSMGMAEVSLFFSNTRHFLNSDHDEIVVTRRLYRSGESEYLLNNTPCRLKDIRELFMDTGIGADAYSVIEQGKVELLLQTSKQDRRAIFEEAAGISKYKARRKEAQRKLERTEQNLLRLTDVIDEIEKRLRSIKLQAGKARNYQTYATRLNELRLHKFLYDYKLLRDKMAELLRQLAEDQDELVGVTTSLGKLQTQLSMLDHQIDQCESEIRESENQLLQCTSQIANQRDRIELGHKRCAELTERIEQGQRQVQELLQNSRTLQEGIAEDRRRIDEIEQQIARQQQDLDTLTEQRQENALRLAEQRAQLEDEKSGLIDIVRRTAQIHNEIQTFDMKRSTLTGQKERLHDRSAQVRQEIEDHLTTRVGLDEKQTEIDTLLAQCREQLESKQQQLAELDQQRATANENLATAKEHRSGLLSRQQILKDLEAKLEGIDQGVQSILRRKAEGNGQFTYVQDMVANIFQADVEHASIVDAALAQTAQHLLVNDSQAALSDQENLTALPSRVQMLCVDRLGPFKDGFDFSPYPQVKGRLLDLVQFSPEVERIAWHLLGKTILVETLDAAFELANIAPAGYRWVTLSGQVLEADGTLQTGPNTAQGGLISRKSELRQIADDLIGVDERIKQLQHELQQMAGQADHLEKNLQELRTSIYENSTELVQIRSRLEQIDQVLARLQQEEPLLAGEIASFEEQIAESLRLQEASEQRLGDLQVLNEQRQQHIDQLEGQIATLDANEQDYQVRQTELKVALGQIRQQHVALVDRIKSVESQIQQVDHNITTQTADVENARNNLTETERGILAAETSLSELFLTRQQHEEKVTGLRTTRDERQEEKEAVAGESQQLQQRRDQLQEALHRDQMKQNELELRQENLAQRADEEIGLDLKLRYLQLFEPQNIPALPEPEPSDEAAAEDASNGSEEEVFVGPLLADGRRSPSQRQEVQEPDLAEQAVDTDALEEMDWEAVAAEIEDLKAKISRLGNVNLDAIAEQEELEQRAGYLNEQSNDLNESIRQLQQLIDKLNQTSREKFQENFARICENFADLFRKLFGGGKAEIILEDPENLLECDIEIIARPPGKQPQSISLLSGGEKTMTAVSLLLAIFKSKPSPFCILDEADAALDEANNERYNLVLKEFLADSQFIIITHSRRTMSIADAIYGVTMQEQGVSRKVSVRFADYDESFAENADNALTEA